VTGVSRIDGAARGVSLARQHPGPHRLERAIMAARGSVIEIDEDLLDEGSRSEAIVSSRRSAPEGWARSGASIVCSRACGGEGSARRQQGVPHDQLVRRFQREAQVRDLRSPHTVQLTTSASTRRAAITSWNCSTASTSIASSPASALNPPRVVMLLRQACRSLAEAHGHALVHRDIKPANLFVTFIRNTTT
jgi:serine/threonine protein kinase